MDVRAKRDVLKLQAVARLDVRMCRREHLAANAQADRRKDVAALAISIANERDTRRAERIILDRLNTARNANLVALEVKHAVATLVAAAAVTRGDVTVVVATTRP